MMLTDFAAGAVVMELVAERRRVLNASQYGLVAHEDSHVKGEMALAAASYALYASGHDELFATISRQPHGKGSNCGWVGAAALFWPKAWGDWTGITVEGGRRACLVRAGQLLIAEIERLDRAKDEGKCLECLHSRAMGCGACGGTGKAKP